MQERIEAFLPEGHQRNFLHICTSGVTERVSAYVWRQTILVDLFGAFHSLRLLTQLIPCRFTCAAAEGPVLAVNAKSRSRRRVFGTKGEMPLAAEADFYRMHDATDFQHRTIDVK